MGKIMLDKKSLAQRWSLWVTWEKRLKVKSIDDDEFDWVSVFIEFAAATHDEALKRALSIMQRYIQKSGHA